MFRRSVLSLMCTTLALTAIASAKSGPITNTVHLSGTYICSSAHARTMTTTWSSVMDGTWLSGADASSNNFVSHDAAAHVYRVASIDKTGGAEVFEGPDTSATHVVFKQVYPVQNQTTTYTYVSPSKYTLTFEGMMHGKPFHDTQTCTKK